MKPGYKHTEVGVIPEDWEVKTLDNLTSLMTNGFVGTATDAYVNSDDGILYIQGYNVQEGGFDFHGIKRVSRAFHASHQKSCLREGDLLTIQTGDIGVTTIIPPELVGANCHALVISRFLKQVSDPKFFCHYFNSERGRSKFKEIETGSTMKHLNVGDMKHLLVPAPPLPEQRAIAGALSDVDALLGAQEALLAKKRDLKAAAMQQLLTGETRLPGFTGEWEVVTMRQVLTQNATYGIVTAGNFVQNGVKMLRGGDIADGRINTDLPMVTLEKSIEYHRTSLAENDVVIALVGYPGASAKIPKELSGSNISRAVGLLRTNSKVSADFLVCFLNSPDGRRMVLAPSAGSAQQVVNLAALNKLQFSLPPLPEQTAIAAVLSDMDAEIAALEAQRDKTRALKQGMMQELLTGRIRLI